MDAGGLEGEGRDGKRPDVLQWRIDRVNLFDEFVVSFITMFFCGQMQV